VPRKPAYPFTPKSNRYLQAGQFWALPFKDGRFACGRVLLVPAFGPTDRIGIVVGLLDWVGDAPPTSVSISGRPVLEEAKRRFEAIANTGGEVLGHRALEDDGIVPEHSNELGIGVPERVWGWRTILNIAERRFG
jgi:hypothetical protein